MKRRNLKWWLLWALATLLLSGSLYAALTTPDVKAAGWRVWARGLLLPGQTTSGHHQIELACESCHGAPWEGREALQKSCVRCHGEELKEARDTHPRSKFTDPRNAERASRLDAASCVTCHVEHRPTMTGRVGLTLPADYCVICHRDVAKERPTHVGAKFTDCTSSGCHNFHDNRALYEDFLVKHAAQPPLLDKRVLPERDFRQVIEELSSYPIERYPLKALSAGDADNGSHLRSGDAIGREWLETAHAKAGVNCSGCHQPDGKGPWAAKPAPGSCKGCHGAEVDGFFAGKHGMRQAAGLGAMTPAEARLPMKEGSAHTELGCATCHKAHRFDTAPARTTACLGCHADRHSLAHEGSPHARDGVGCASCHMPRVEHRTDDVKRTLVRHNQNDTLRPGDKMVRPVCMNCHGLQFSLDALADRALVAANFRGQPKARVPGIAWALDAARRADESRKSHRPNATQGDPQ